MKKWIQSVLVLVAIVLGVQAQAQVNAETTHQTKPAGQGNDWQSLVREIDFRPDLMQAMKAGAPLDDGVMPYEWTGATDAGKLEVRLAFRPIQRLEIKYDDPHGNAPDPDHIFKMVFERLLQTYAYNSVSIDQEYTPSQSREKFRAEWAGASIFDLRDDLKLGYKQGMLVAMHRSEVADVYALFLFNDPEVVRGSLKDLISKLGFVSKPKALKREG